MMASLLSLLLLLALPPAADRKAPTTGQQLQQVRRDLDRYADLDITDQEAIGDLQEHIFSSCLALLNKPASAQLDLRQLLDHQAMHVIGTTDGRLWLLSLDQRTGGSFRQRRTMAQLRSPDGRVHAFPLGNSELEGYALCDLSIAYFEGLVTLDDSTYYTVATTIGCSTCIDLCATMLRVRDLHLEPREIFAYSGRMGMMQHFDLDPDTRTFTYAYEQLEDDPLYPMEGLPRRSGSFHYVAGEFQETSRCEHR